MRSRIANKVAPSWRRHLGQALGVAVLVVAGGMGGLPVVSNSLGIAPAAASEVVRSKPRIESELLHTLQSGKPARYAIYLERPDLSRAYDMDWQARGRYVHETLKNAAEQYQQPLRDYMSARGYSFQSFWVDNLILVENGDIDLFNDLSRFSGVKQVRTIPEVHLIKPEPAGLNGTPPGPLPNLNRVKVPQVWEAGFRGQGIVLANIDSGVRFSHEALREKYRGNLGGTYDHNYNFYNPYSSVIGDSDDHGSHVMGTMLGGTATETIGVAPEATWIACRGFNPGVTDAGLLGCGQWIAAPTDLSGQNPDPDRRPHAVNNSWGDCGRILDPWYQGVVDSWLAAGIFPTFSNGNSGNCGYSSPPPLNTVGNPARYGSLFSVGSTGNNNGEYATHSNWGPTDNPSLGLPDFPDHAGYPNLKPNVVAPGVGIRSAVSGSDTAYANFTGTSMSSPHAAGLVALMWSAAPCLIGDYAKTGTLIQETAIPIPYNTGGTPAPGPGNVPNYATGWGEIDAEAAVTMAIGQCGPQGVIAGVVTDADDASPLDAVQVTLDNPNPPPPSYQAVTALDGSYSRTVGATVPGEGTYTAHFSRFGYLPETVSGIEVAEDVTTTVSVALEPAPSVTVSGVVTDSLGGWPLYASVDIDGYPFGAVYTDPVTGTYEVDLPEGSIYSFSFNAVAIGYDGHAETLDLTAGGGGDVTLDVTLDANQASCEAPGYSVEDFSTESFEASNGGYTTDQPTVFQWGEPSSNLWPNGCASGTKCWATNLTGSYPSNANATLTSPLIDLGAYSGPLVVLWNQANHIETHNWDKAFVEISVNGGTWQEAWRNPSATVAEPWRQLRYDIESFSGGTLQFRVRFTSDGSVNHPGLFIDDVRIANPTCSAGEGGYVVGQVSDANTAAPLNDVRVETGDGDSVQTAADPGSGDTGFYQLWAEAGANSVTASRALYASNTTPITVTDGANQRVDIALGSAALSLSPTSISKAVELGQTDSDVLKITNSGSGDAVVSLIAGSPKQDFESDFPPPGWSVVNAAGSTAGCGWKRNDQWEVDNLAGGDGFSAVANSDACGSGTTTSSFLVSPELDFSANAVVSLGYVLAYRNLSTGDSLKLETSADGGITWATVTTYTASVSPTGPGQLQSVDLSAQLAGVANARFRFHYAGGWAWWAHVDQVELSTDGVAWLGITPSSDILVPAGGEVDVALDFDAGAVSSVGAFSTQLSLIHDTPSAVSPVSVTMNVTAPASYGEIIGTVSGLGYCGADPAPIADAEVTVTGNAGSYTTSTNASGQYSVFLDAGEGPVEVAVAADGHEAGSASDVAVTGSAQTTQDFALGALLGCTTLEPATPSFAVTLRSGQSDTRTVQLDNAGLAAAAFSTAKRAPTVTVNLIGQPGSAPLPVSAALRVASGTPFQQREATGALLGGGINVLVLSPDNGESPAPVGLTALLDAMPELNATLFPAANLPSINAAALSPYDVVLVANNTKWLDVGNVSPVVVGNALADYVDGGGKVVLANFAHDNAGWELGGRLITGGYSPFNTATADLSGTVSLGTILEPDHPIIAGITTLGASGTVSTQAITVKATATRIANWSNSQPLVAVNGDASVVAINLLAGDLGSGSFSWTGQVPELIRNAVVDLSGGGFSADWLSFDPASGSVPAGGSAEVDLVFTALPELEPGTYEAIAVIRVEDGPDNKPSFDIPVTLTIATDKIFADGFEPSP
ncbi:MAG: S8 family serine peptidase [Lysobacteraceae bacterium]